MILRRVTAVVWTAYCDCCQGDIGNMSSRGDVLRELTVHRWRQEPGDVHYCPKCAAGEEAGG